MVVAKYIDTDLWNKIIDLLQASGWEMTYVYDGMDAGIDYNKYVLVNLREEIVFEWTNWDEGEIRCTSDRLKEIEKLSVCTFNKVEAFTGLDPRASGSRA